MITSQIILPLNRPQYVPAPEGFISALAWSLFTVEANNTGRRIGYRFKKTELDKAYVAVDMRYNFPEELADQLTLTKSLHSLGVIEPANTNRIGEAVVNSVLGTRSEKSKFQPASPMSPSLALMQNYVGILGTANPPDLAGIMESLYSLGNPADEDRRVANQWLDAVEHRLTLDPLLRAVDSSINETILEAPRELQLKTKAEGARASSDSFPNSPFAWFAQVWPRLTSKEWVEALPAKVWTDWATTVLRLSFGLGYLFEVTWYETVAKELLGSSPPTWSKILDRMGSIVPWQKSNLSTVNRDVASRLKWRVYRGVQIREILSKWISVNMTHENEQADDAFIKMHADSELRKKLTSALISKDDSGSATNLWEAIKYSLTVREQDGEFADYYGMFRRHQRKFLFVDPGTEWISVIASLTSELPNQTVDLKRVMGALKLLGTEPDQLDLLDLLERAGSSRGSADAGQGVSVKTAY